MSISQLIVTGILVLIVVLIILIFRNDFGNREY